MMKHILHASGV
uniref:Uncharacterized protein n=1 Tax=Rhizophora mucronata TaxID=61149 RepID=A0A2P2QTM7_RHIMU